ncbi:MAG: OmpA family protein, partial [Bacteroidota bacterium]|nr:OmpA family protein [Bacteroidota bacterium]MDX5429615.1 OmpA family protein [Bacteroidota bacterium]MDX5468399.1 OmpA family protein [Bacteroidota bacterium]
YDSRRKPIPMPAYIRMQGRENLNERSYIQAPLLVPLSKGVFYTLEIEYSFPDDTYGELGLFLSDSFVHVDSKMVYQVDSLTGIFRQYRIDSLLRHSPQYQFQLNAGIIRTGKYRSTLRFQATGKERFIILGNFNADDATPRTSGPLNRGTKESHLLAIHSIALHSESEPDPICDEQLDLLRSLNRRHTHYGRCSDSAEIDMNELFQHLPEWSMLHSDSVLSPQVPVQLEKAYRIENLLFSFDSSVIMESSFRSLDSLAKLFDSYTHYSIEIIGHTDSLGRKSYNDSLSYSRARAVADYLIDKGIDFRRISVKGKGSSEPVASNASEEGRAINRRVEFILRDPEDGK